MNKHLSDLSEVAAMIVSRSSRPESTTTEVQVVKVPLELIKQLQLVIEQTPLMEVNHTLWKDLKHAVDRQF